jgi:O-antigen ligase
LVAFAFYLGGLYPVIAVGLRGAMVALVLGLGAVALLTGNARRKAPLALLLILLIPSSIKLLERTAQLPEQVVDHVTLKDEGGPQEMARLQFQGTTALRFKIWQVALETFKEAPFTGVGLSQFVLEARERVELRHRSVGPHNAYLGTLAELGLVGLILLLWGECIIAVYLLRHRLLPSHDQGHAVHAILLALFVTALVGGVFSTLVRLKMLWVTCALVIAATRYCLWSQSGSPTTPPLQASVAVGADDRKEARCGS